MKYPEVLEQWWLAEMRKIVKGADDRARLDWMRAHVARLSDLFTTERTSEMGDYYKDSHRTLAYGLFYFPQTFLRTAHVLSELEARGAELFPEKKDGAFRVLEMGAGLGASTFAVALHAKNPIEITAMDQVASGLSVLSRISGDLRDQWPNVRFRSKVGDLKKTFSWPEGTWDMMVSSFALNEAFEASEESVWQEWIRQALSKLEPDGKIILIEPALSVTSQRLQALRDYVLEKKLAQVVAPCCHQASCPMLARAEIWCHEARKWKSPESLSYLDRKLFRATDALKFSFLVLQKSTSSVKKYEGQDFARLVSPIRELKGRITTYGCAADGVIHSYEIQTRDLSKVDKKAFLKTERGDILHWKEIKEIGDQKVLRAKGFQALVSPRDGLAQDGGE